MTKTKIRPFPKITKITFFPTFKEFTALVGLVYIFARVRIVLRQQPLEKRQKKANEEHTQ